MIHFTAISQLHLGWCVCVGIKRFSISNLFFYLCVMYSATDTFIDVNRCFLLRIYSQKDYHHSAYFYLYFQLTSCHSVYWLLDECYLYKGYDGGPHFCSSQ